jgi:hypothetical protein
MVGDAPITTDQDSSIVSGLTSDMASKKENALLLVDSVNAEGRCCCCQGITPHPGKQGHSPRSQGIMP